MEWQTRVTELLNCKSCTISTGNRSYILAAGQERTANIVIMKGDNHYGMQ